MCCFGCPSATADLAFQRGFCPAQMGRARLGQQQAGEGVKRRILLTVSILQPLLELLRLPVPVLVRKPGQ